MNARDPMTQPNGLSACLPPDAREMLARAAREAKLIDNPAARNAHLQTAIARVQSKYPTFFKEV
jgi:uncharacterized protein (DUF1778 family)